MSAPLRLVIFDVDGTLVDSQADIVASMTAAWDGSADISTIRMAVERAAHPAAGTLSHPGVCQPKVIGPATTSALYR